MPALEITSRIRVRADPQRVWDLAMDWGRQREWVPATVVRGGSAVGAEVVARTGLGRAGFTDTMVITEWTPPRRCVVRHTGKVVRGRGVFEVVPQGELSEFRWTELIDLPVPAAVRPAATWLGQRTVAPLARLALDYALRRFARLVMA
ncbi:MAG TPA: SRPBCC family protein [Streptosporangiaceae bacterium]|jgi:carbon monoxide dehydrogenase subunit G|nr:SRPBCC family protein [Streptosporangiaceae bacterium]